MKVTTSCSGRFHIYDQARELERHGILHKLISDYPTTITDRWNIPKEKTITLLGSGIKSRVARLINPYLGESTRSVLAKKLHAEFSKKVARKIPEDSDVYIGLSSLCLTAIRKANVLGIKSIVDHGSNHLRFDFEEVNNELIFWGLRPKKVDHLLWAIEQEDLEFDEADNIFLMSSLAKETLVSRGVNPKKIFINHCGVDLSSFYPGKKNDDVFRVIQVGSISVRKGVLQTIKVFNDLSLANSELWFVGAIDGDEEFRKKIRQLSSKNIKFIDPVPQSHLVKIYQQSSVFVLPSVSDGFGMVVLQAMACGIPVVVSSHVGAKDVIKSGVNGFVFNSRDANEFMRIIEFLYKNPVDRYRIGLSGMEITSSKNGWDCYGNNLANFLMGMEK
jgi:glycosyltransferase involved in cell wall biosynthesis